jgi:hypothetical protein
MSYTFEVGDETVWDPALRVGKLFLGQAQAVADGLGLPSGLTPQRDGTCQVEPREYAAFLAEFQNWYLRSDHPELLLLAKGVLTVALALLLRTGRQPPTGGGDACKEMLAEATLRARGWA